MITNINFKVIGYNGVESLSSYSLSSTPLLFIPETLPFENPNVLWDFGDGTISRSISASKYYNFPGQYNVKFILYDCYNNPLESIYNKDITISDYFPLTFNVTTSNLNLSCGKISGPLLINAYFPPYQKPISIYYSISGSESDNYWAIESNKYAHLDNYYSLYDRFYNYSLKSYQFREISNIETVNSEIYGRIQDGEIKICKSTDSDAFFIGISGKKECYIKDDSINSLVVYFYFDKTKYTVPNIQHDLNYFNNLGIRIPFTVANNIPTQLSITSNGLDGEYYAVSSFEINPIKYFNTWIPFIVKLKDYEWYSVKTFNSVELSALAISLSASIDGTTYLLDSSQYKLSSLNYTLSSQDHGGSFRGVLYFNENTYPLLDVKFSISLSATNNTTTYIFNKESNSFNVYPLNYFDMYKKNENFDGSNTLRDITFQESLLNKDKLYDDFFATILGDENSDHEGISRKIYEKISNFTQNTQDVDVCNLDALESISLFLSYTNINEEYYKYPEKIKRLIDLLSINKNKLLGTGNKFRENFDTRGYTSKTEYGKNIGNILDTTTYKVSAGTDIVALEKFSNTYTRLDTEQPPYIADSSVGYNMVDEIDGRINNTMSMSANGSVYTTQNHALSVYVRNPNLWCADVDLTCASPWNSSGSNTQSGTLITPRHILFAAHYTYGPGTLVRFVDNDNNLYTRMVVGLALHPDYIPYYPDLAICTLNEDLPFNITPCDVMPLEWVDDVNNIVRVPLVGFDQEEKALIQDITLINTTTTTISPIDPVRSIFYETKIGGDSGDPVFFIYNGKMVLVTVWTYPTSGTSIPSFIDDINTMIITSDTMGGIMSVDDPTWPNDGSHYQLKEAEKDIRYPLSAYNSDWGWPLVIPSVFNFSEIDKYYLFFEYVNTYDNTLMGSVIDYTNPKTTIASSMSGDLFESVVENMFLSNLYESLPLIK